MTTLQSLSLHSSQVRLSRHRISWNFIFSYALQLITDVGIEHVFRLTNLMKVRLPSDVLGLTLW
jgi:hypothetical protein